MPMSKEQAVTTLYEQSMEQEMSVKGPEARVAIDSGSDDSPSRKRPIHTADSNALHIDSNALHLNDGDLENESDEAKRQKTDFAGNRKPNTDPWDAMFSRLAAYKAEKGDCLVPKRYAPDPKLGTWVETQRVQYKRLQREFDASKGVEQVQPNKRLDQSRLAKLNSIGFAWSAKTQRKSSPLQDSSGSQENATVLHQKGKVRKPGFEEMGPSARNAARVLILEAHWNEMYERLVRYKEEHGDTLVPRKYDKDPRLAAFVEAQRVLWNRDFREIGAVASEANTGAELDFFQGTDATNERGILFSEDAGITMELYNPLEKLDEEGNVAEQMNQTSIDLANKEDFDSMNSTTEFKHLSVERKVKLDKLGFIWSLRTKRIEDHWDDMFRQLVEYKNIHGDCLVPSRYEENLKLGKWIETQRYEYTKLLRVSTDAAGTSEVKRSMNPRLTDERRRRLESIGFEWKVRNKMKRYYDKQWDQMFDRLLEFKAKQGHCLVPKRYPDDMKLATWVHTQRVQNRKLLEGNKNQASDRNSDTASQVSDKSEDEANNFRLTDDRRKRLTDIGFVWSVREAERTHETTRIVRTSYDVQWDAMFNLLISYKEKYGDCLVPKRYAENPKLGTWCDTQRVLHKKMKKRSEGDDGADSSAGKAGGGRLTEERIRRLEDLGFVWSLRDDWQKHYDELKEFKKENAHCNVPARYAKNRRLGIFVCSQRQQYKVLQKLTPSEKQNVRLNEERIKLLNDLGFTWTIRSRDTPSEMWNQKVSELKTFREMYGHCNVPVFYHDNPELRSWVELQRILYQQYIMNNANRNDGESVSEQPYSDLKIRILEDIGFDWIDRMNQSSETSTGIDALQKASSLASAQLGDSATSDNDHLYDTTCCGV